MAYNGYGAYTQYYHSQQPKVNDRGSQFSNQNTASSSSYQRQAYTAPSDPHQQQSSQHTYGTSISYSGADNNNGMGYPSSYVSDIRTTGTASALGNLAHASTLRQTSGDPIQRVVNYNKQHGLYDQAHNDGQNYQRSDSQGVTNSRISGNIDSPSAPAYQANQQYNSYRVSSHGTSYSQQQSSRWESGDARIQSQQSIAPPSRPASGQSVQDSQQQASQSPNISYAGSNGAAPVVQSRNLRVSRPSSAQHLHAQVGLAGKALIDQNHDRRHSVTSTNQQTTQRSKASKVPSISNVTTTPTPEIQSNVTPTTIDPNVVFNQYEYQKRQVAVAAEAEAKKRTAETEEAKKREEMELEMKLMLEKMREYKSKDPTLFSQIWEQVKKAQPPGFTAKDASLNVTELPASKEVALPSPIVSAKTFNNPPVPSIQNTTTENRKLPDRGKFPAARRGKPGRRSRDGRVLTMFEGYNNELFVNSDAEEPNANLTHTGTMNAQTPLQSAAKPVRGRNVENIWVSGKQVQLSSKQISAASMIQPSISQIEPSPVMCANTTPRPSGQTMWPEADKLILATAASDTLLGNPVNAGKSITPNEIHALLNLGPSYEELCRILEGRGFVVDRTPFAQKLLSAVPRLKDAQPTPAKIASLQSIYPPAKVSAKSTATKKQRSSKQRVTNENSIAPTALMIGEIDPSQLNSLSQNRPSSTNSNMSPTIRQSVSSPQSTISKQQSARKRNFDEIVDLTVEVSSDEELKRERAEFIRKMEQIKHMQAVKAAMDAATKTIVNDSSPKIKSIRPSPGIGLSSSAPSEDDITGLSRFKVATPQRERLRKSKNIVKPISRDDALRRSNYHSRTVARDILIAAGKHPTMSALNYHLDPLRAQFRHIEYHSDLSTFRWDLVDPGGPPVKSRNVEIEKPIDEQANDADDADNEEADTPIYRPSAPSGPVMGFFSPMKISGRGRGRPRGPRPSRGAFHNLGVALPHQRSPQNTQTVNSTESGDISMLGAGEAGTAVTSHLISSGQVTPLEPHAENTSPGSSGQKPRRGRPPKNRTPTSVKLKNTPPITLPSRLNPTANSSSSEIPELQITETNMHRSTNTPVRPSGLRNQLTASPFAVVIPSPDKKDSKELDESGRPIRTKRTPPKILVYKCRWRGCQGELHNLDTLKKHVRKHMHMQSFKEDLQCLWQGCGTTLVTSSDKRQPLEFKSETAWQRHMDGRHLDHYAWELGDGPSTHTSDAEASDYLSDSQNRQVTPIASPENPRPDTFNLATIPRDERAKVAKAFHTAHGNKTETEKAQAVFDNVVERRRKLGPGIERAGHKFVTDEKRALLQTGPDLRKVDDKG